MNSNVSFLVGKCMIQTQKGNCVIPIKRLPEIKIQFELAISPEWIDMLKKFIYIYKNQNSKKVIKFKQLYIVTSICVDIAVFWGVF